MIRNCEAAETISYAFVRLLPTVVRINLRFNKTH